jgi:uncharacterized membrane protein YeaQ/YmgE (transglycosylase-associated protein family)
MDFGLNGLRMGVISWTILGLIAGFIASKILNIPRLSVLELIHLIT